MKDKKSKLIQSIILSVAVFSACFLAGCAAPKEDVNEELSVFVAASLTGAFTELSDAYEASHEGVSVACVYDGTQKLRTQFEEGAYADVFVSANTKHMAALMDEGLMDNSTVASFLKNRLVVIVPKNNPAGITNLSGLTDPGVKIVIGTKDVPVGSYARQVLDKLAADPSYGEGYRESLLSNVISEETAVTGIVMKVGMEEADAGFAYSSDVTRDMESKVSTIEIPKQYNVIAEYQLGIMKESGNAGLAADYIEFMRSAEGSAILESYGFEAA